MSVLSRKSFLLRGALAAVAGFASLRAAPAAAESQSSDSSSGCSNGHCRRIDRLTVEGRDGRRTTTRTEHWREVAARGRDDDDDRRLGDSGARGNRGRRRDDDEHD